MIAGTGPQTTHHRAPSTLNFPNFQFEVVLCSVKVLLLKKQGKMEGGLYPGGGRGAYNWNIRIHLLTGRWAHNRGGFILGFYGTFLNKFELLSTLVLVWLGRNAF